LPGGGDQTNWGRIVGAPWSLLGAALCIGQHNLARGDVGHLGGAGEETESVSAYPRDEIGARIAGPRSQNPRNPAQTAQPEQSDAAVPRQHRDPPGQRTGHVALYRSLPTSMKVWRRRNLKAPVTCNITCLSAPLSGVLLCLDSFPSWVLPGSS